MAKFAAVPISFFGYGCLIEVKNIILREKFKRIFIISSKDLVELKIVGKVINDLDINDYVLFDNVVENPTIENVKEGSNLFNISDCDCIIAIGGGSVLDCAKAIRLNVSEGGEIEKYKIPYVVKNKGVFLICVNTTQGTGSEVSRAFLINIGSNKSIYKDDYCIPDVAVNDVSIMMELPKKITAFTVFDALTHSIESYISTNTFEICKILSIQAIKIIFENLQKVFSEDKVDINIRENLSLAQYLAGLSFGSAGLGLVHSISHQLSAIYNLPHGLCNAIILPYVLEFYKEKISLDYEKIEKEIGLDKDFIQIINELLIKVEITEKLSDLGVKKEDFELLAKKTLDDGCIGTSPYKPSQIEIIEILKRAF